MSQLLRIQLKGETPRLVHGRRPDRRARERQVLGGLREGPVWNSPRPVPPRRTEANPA